MIWWVVLYGALSIVLSAWWFFVSEIADKWKQAALAYKETAVKWREVAERERAEKQALERSVAVYRVMFRQSIKEDGRR